MTNYVLTETIDTRCPQCGRRPMLLCNPGSGSPAFYICFDCRQAAQVGKGPVPEVGKAALDTRAAEGA